MRGQQERFATFSFSAICVSQSSVEVVENHPKKLQTISNPTPTSEIQLQRRMKSTFPHLHKVFQSFKCLSFMFQSYKEEDDDADEEIEMVIGLPTDVQHVDDEVIEMVIGLPTDVQHVAHIGWDGFNSWDKGQEFSPPTISLKQFELAMAASQAN